MIFAQVSTIFPDDVKGYKDRKTLETGLFNPNIRESDRRKIDYEIAGLPKYLPRTSYQWPIVFDGYWLCEHQIVDWSSLDVILVDLIQPDFGLITRIRKKYKGKIIATLSTREVSDILLNTDLLELELNAADYVFMDSTYKCELFSHLRKDIHLIRTPIDFGIREENPKIEKEEKEIFVLCQDIEMALSLTGLGYKTSLLTPFAIPVGRQHLFANLVNHTSRYLEVLDFIIKNRPIIIDLDFNEALLVESAALSLPNIGYNLENRKILYPNLIVDFRDFRAIQELLKNEEFLLAKAEDANNKACSLFSYEASKKEFLKMISK